MVYMDSLIEIDMRVFIVSTFFTLTLTLSLPQLERVSLFKTGIVSTVGAESG